MHYRKRAPVFYSIVYISAYTVFFFVYFTQPQFSWHFLWKFYHSCTKWHVSFEHCRGIFTLRFHWIMERMVIEIIAFHSGIRFIITNNINIATWTLKLTMFNWHFFLHLIFWLTFCFDLLIKWKCTTNDSEIMFLQKNRTYMANCQNQLFQQNKSEKSIARLCGIRRKIKSSARCIFHTK